MKKPFVVFLVCFGAIAALTLLFPIKLYNGEALHFSGMTEEVKLSLSFLVRKSEFLKAYPSVKDIYLNKIGWAMVVCVNFALPLMIAYRVSLGKKKKEDK